MINVSLNKDNKLYNSWCDLAKNFINSYSFSPLPANIPSTKSPKDGAISGIGTVMRMKWKKDTVRSLGLRRGSWVSSPTAGEAGGGPGDATWWPVERESPRRFCESPGSINKGILSLKEIKGNDFCKKICVRTDVAKKHRNRFVVNHRLCIILDAIHFHLCLIKKQNNMATFQRKLKM